MPDKPNLIETAPDHKADVIDETLERVGLEATNPDGIERIRGTYPRLIWPHLDSHQLFVRINVDGKEVEAELSIGHALDWMQLLARAMGRMVRQ